MLYFMCQHEPLGLSQMPFSQEILSHPGQAEIDTRGNSLYINVYQEGRAEKRYELSLPFFLFIYSQLVF